MIKGRYHTLTSVLVYLFLTAFVLLMMFPFLLIISISFREGNLALGSLIPERISFEHWRFVLGLPVLDASGRVVQETSHVLRWLGNSVIVASVSSVLILLFSATGAYAFARLRFAGKHQILTGLMILQMFPQVLSLVAIYAILDLIGRYIPALGLNTHPGLVLVYTGGVAIHIWMIKGYFDTIPASIEESAMIDGASTFQTFLGILLPMSLPIFAVVFILSFIAFIGEYPVAAVVLTKTDSWTLAVGANSFLYEQHYQWGRFAATAVLSGIPISVMFLACQKFLISGLTSGGVKG